MDRVVRRAVAWFIDYLIVGGLVGVFYFCACVFFLERSTMRQGELMLVSALVTVIALTVCVPTRLDGQTIGDRCMHLRVRNKSRAPRTYLQSFVRECVLKFVLAPFFAVFSAFYFAVHCMLRMRDPNYELLHDYFLKTTVVDAP